MVLKHERIFVMMRSVPRCRSVVEIKIDLETSLGLEDVVQDRGWHQQEHLQDMNCDVGSGQVSRQLRLQTTPHDGTANACSMERRASADVQVCLVHCLAPESSKSRLVGVEDRFENLDTNFVGEGRDDWKDAGKVNLGNGSIGVQEAYSGTV